MEETNMRVFDIYTYNIASKAKIKDTKKFIDKMLADLGLQYEEILVMGIRIIH
jgi:hypothetical protein